LVATTAQTPRTIGQSGSQRPYDMSGRILGFPSNFRKSWKNSFVAHH
jgi:hypothetical protein